uniref:Uncharacterized protein n=1 Tax=Ditylenchus dipsaci TaxID=166011 RepID=A0A915DE72_9BILA
MGALYREARRMALKRVHPDLEIKISEILAQMPRPLSAPTLLLTVNEEVPMAVTVILELKNTKILTSTTDKAINTAFYHTIRLYFQIVLIFAKEVWGVYSTFISIIPLFGTTKLTILVLGSGLEHRKEGPPYVCGCHVERMPRLSPGNCNENNKSTCRGG